MITPTQLPYNESALAPHISEQTVQVHYHKHHKGYVDKLNNALQESDCEFDTSASLEEIIEGASGSLYNHAAQVWNHDFYWHCMKPYGGGPATEVADRILSEHFGSVENFISEMKSAAASEFGSGWAWLVRTVEGDLKILSTTDAQNPLSNDMQPLLVVDVWEHAYYLDYQNERGAYLDAFFEHLINWEFLEKNLEQAARDAA